MTNIFTVCCKLVAQPFHGRMREVSSDGTNKSAIQVKSQKCTSAHSTMCDPSERARRVISLRIAFKRKSSVFPALHVLTGELLQLKHMKLLVSAEVLIKSKKRSLKTYFTSSNFLLSLSTVKNSTFLWRFQMNTEFFSSVMFPQWNTATTDSTFLSLLGSLDTLRSLLGFEINRRVWTKSGKSERVFFSVGGFRGETLITSNCSVGETGRCDLSFQTKLEANSWQMSSLWSLKQTEWEAAQADYRAEV